jgi:hypothetical protein
MNRPSEAGVHCFLRDSGDAWRFDVSQGASSTETDLRSKLKGGPPETCRKHAGFEVDLAERRGIGQWPTRVEKK